MEGRREEKRTKDRSTLRERASFSPSISFLSTLFIDDLVPCCVTCSMKLHRFLRQAAAASPPASRRLPLITLYTGGPECSLCEDAKQALYEISQLHPFELETINIRHPEHKKWRRLYQYDIPVIKLGSHVVKHRIDKDALLKRLREATMAAE